MSEPTCEDVQCSVMAERDGERPSLEAALVEGHLASCDDCRRALELDEAVRAALSHRARALQRPSPTWPAVSRAIERPRRWVPVAAAAIVVVAQALVLGPGVGLGWPARVVPLVGAMMVFAALRTNPFRVDAALT